jgi:exopolysaccharide biosynthesis operon protein EpsL
MWAVAAISLAAVAPAARALEGDTVFLRATAGATYNSNVLGVSNEIPPAQVQQLLGGRSEGAWILDYGAGLRCDLPVSRQRFKLDLSATRYDYNQYNELTYTGYTGRGAWEWRAGNEWWGNLGAGVAQTRETYSAGVALNVPALVKNYNALADAHYALTPRWELNGSLTGARSRYSAVALQSGDLNQKTESLGALYRSPLGNATGLRVTFEQGEWPNQPPVAVSQLDNTYTQYTLALVVDWHLTVRSELTGDIGYTARTRTQVGKNPTVEGPSGRLTYTYALTGKSQVLASLYQTFGPLDDPTASYVKTTGLDLGYSLQATAKISLQASATWQKIDYLGESLIPGAVQRRDTYTILGLGARYQATRTLSVSAGAQYQNRNSNIPLAAYDVYTLSLSATIEF